MYLNLKLKMFSTKKIPIIFFMRVAYYIYYTNTDPPPTHQKTLTGPKSKVHVSLMDLFSLIINLIFMIIVISIY